MSNVFYQMIGVKALVNDAFPPRPDDVAFSPSTLNVASLPRRDIAVDPAFTTAASSGPNPALASLSGRPLAEHPGKCAPHRLLDMFFGTGG